TSMARKGRGQCTDASRLVDDEQCFSVLPESVYQRPELGLIVRQAAIRQAFTRTVQCNVVAGLFDINANDDLDIVMVFDLGHASSKKSRWSATYGSYSRHPRYGRSH